ncbi:MAG TPA: SigB/SigF/SigG family RNA polymerase sigma factor [Streptosporangiaceae bacterium]
MTRVRIADEPAGDDRQASDHELVAVVQSLAADDPRRTAAFEELIARHESIVRSCVHRYRDTPEPADDLMQVGYLALIKAILNFDPAVGENLAAYAQPSVSGEIKRHFRDKRWHIRVRRSAQELRLQIRAATPDLAQQLTHTPTNAEIAAHLQVSAAELAEAQQAGQAFQASSLDAPLPGEDPASLGDFLGAEDQLLEQTVDMESVWKHWAELPEREQRLLMMRFYGNMTQAEIGAELGISQMHVSRLMRRALAYIREHLTDATAGAGPAPGAGDHTRRSRPGRTAAVAATRRRNPA